ncbi:hypothetical protein DFH07DRAFT_1066286 [Mycena maculata]|uniref:Uncharacterized protein n=1 Tax=Mycena maculata TaxID=230809 RepID=A0AAD7HVZ5_9AGAR|nr:hypothetical protein DFH07DRAFT_1066286 [Mycena maculata]
MSAMQQLQNIAFLPSELEAPEETAIREHLRILNDEAAFLKAKVAKLRDLRADMGLPPVHIDLPPPGPKTRNDKDAPARASPTAGERPFSRRERSKIAQRAFRRRRHQLLVYEVAALKVELGELHMRMPPAGRWN